MQEELLGHHVWLALLQPTTTWAGTLADAGALAIVLFGFGVFVYALFADWIYTRGRHNSEVEHWRQVAEEKEEQAQALRVESSRRHDDIVRLTQDYQQFIRHLLDRQFKE